MTKEQFQIAQGIHFQMEEISSVLNPEPENISPDGIVKRLQRLMYPIPELQKELERVTTEWLQNKYNELEKELNKL